MVNGERIVVTVRVKPFSKKEIAKNEVSAWECINESTIKYKNTPQEQHGLPTTYTYDRVFSGESSTREVYDAGAKDTVLSVVNGIHTTIFAYGQTSTGKTYTMKGITKYATEDIFDYVGSHEERTFVLKFSAIEIYNEVVKDLLSKDNQPLRVLDDPVKGTFVEKLKEEIVRDLSHLKHLISVCEVRRTRETVLNEKSSRSHQILRLTIESSDRKTPCQENPMKLSATLNFVDLAGSDKTPQAQSSESKLKEDRCISRSLLTLGTVIRKLSKGKQGHINYRDSKLTRILQTSLAVNARIAIICTLSPARSQVEHSRSTLLFASSAKEMSTKTSVNVVKPEKSLVQKLQEEILRLESELEKKDLQIEKMYEDILEISTQRDLAETRVKDLLLVIENLEKTASQTANKLEDTKEGLIEVEEEPLEKKLTPLQSDVDYPSTALSSDSQSFTELALADALIQNLQASEEDGLQSVHAFVKGLKEAHAHFEEQVHSQETHLSEQLRPDSSDSEDGTSEDPEAADWPEKFKKMQKAIINFWQSCNVPLVHRTYFFLLFKGDPSDKIYMEVELRRLTFLKQTLSSENQLPKDDPRSVAASAKILSQERKMLIKLMKKRYTKEERNMLFKRWGIPLESKGRKFQLLISIWTKVDDIQHITESAEIVANLIKFSEQGQGTKDMLGLRFSSPQHKRSWKDSIASLI